MSKFKADYEKLRTAYKKKDMTVQNEASRD